MTVSAEFRSSAFAAETGEVWLLLLTFEHDDLTEPFRDDVFPGPIRVVNNNEDVVSNGELYHGVAFDIVLPIDSSDRPPLPRLAVDNVSRELIETLREISSPPKVTIQIVRFDDPDTVELIWQDFVLRDAKWDELRITGTLSQDDITTETFPVDVFSPAQFRGLI